MYLLIVPYISCTQLLLGYLPPSRELWEKELMENRLKYAKLKEELLLSPVRCCPSCRLAN